MISLLGVCTKLPSMQTTFSGSIIINLKWHTMNSFVECSSYLTEAVTLCKSSHFGWLLTGGSSSLSWGEMEIKD